MVSTQPNAATNYSVVSHRSDAPSPAQGILARSSFMEAGFNFEPLTPTAFLLRSAHIFPDRIAVVQGALKFTYGELLERSLKFAGALRGLGVQPGDRVAVLAGN